MNWDQVQAQWKQLSGKVRSKWGKLTDDDVSFIGGKKDSFVGKLQERYGMMKDDAERAIDEFIAGIGTSKDDRNPQGA
ncbi:MAG TPA: CsbD family protein [Labilithrix sp.]